MPICCIAKTKMAGTFRPIIWTVFHSESRWPLSYTLMTSKFNFCSWQEKNKSKNQRLQKQKHHYQDKDMTQQDKNLFYLEQMLFYGLWMSRWKNGSDIADQWRKRLLRTSAVSPHSDCCCHSGQRLRNTAQFGRTAWPCLVWKSRNFLMGMNSVLHEIKCCLHFTVQINLLTTETFRHSDWWLDKQANTQAVLPELVSHKDNPAFQQEGGKNTYHLSYA